MMVNPKKGEVELFDKIVPWLIVGEKEGDPPTLKPDAPEEIKEAYEEWLRKYWWYAP